MNPLLVLVATAALGVEVGWEPLPTGGHEYTIQIEPQLLGVLERGTEEIFSEVPPELNVRRYRIKVGTGPLPRNAGEPAAAVPSRPDRPLPAANDFDSLPPGGKNDTGPGAGVKSETQPDEPAPDGTEAGVLGAGANREPPGGQPPGKLPTDAQAAGPIEPAGFNSQPDESHDAAPVHTKKPTLADEPERPWSVLVGSVVLLCCSLGANGYLGWIAWDARHRYRNAVAKFRTAS
jgi:hypothetical protein